MKDSLFILSHSEIGGSSEYYFDGPSSVSQDEFIKLCDYLLDDAASMCLMQEDSYIGWAEIIECLSLLLEEEGFKQFVPKMCSYSGPGIIDGANSFYKNEKTKYLVYTLNSIIAHNEKITNSNRM